MNRKIKIISLIAIFAFLINPVFAEDQMGTTPQSKESIPAIPKSSSNELSSEIVLCTPKESVSISLEDSLRIALEKNLNIKIIRSQKENLQWQYYNSISTFLPNIGYELRKTRFGGNVLVGSVIPVNIVETSTSTKFLGSIDTSFSEIFNAVSAKYTYRSAQKNFDFTKDQVLLNTAVAYYRTLEAKYNVEILKANLEQTQEQLRLNQERFNAGVGTKFDVLRSEAEVALAQQNLIEANNRLRLNQAQFANTIGENVFTPYMPLDEDVKPKTLVIGCLNDNMARQLAIQNRPDLQALQLNINAARAARNSGYSSYLPVVTFSGEIGHIGTSQTDLLPNRSGTILVTWNGGAGLGLLPLTYVQSLNAQVREQKFRLINETRNVEQSIINSFSNTITARELIDASAKQVNSAEESRRLALVRLQAGVGLYIDVLNAQSDATRAKIRYLTAIMNYNISQVQLLFDIGVISANNILDGFDAQTALSQTPPKK